MNLTIPNNMRYIDCVLAKSSAGILTPKLKESKKLSIEGLFLRLSFMVSRAQAPSGGRFSLSGGKNLCSAYRPILTSVVRLDSIKEAFTMLSIQDHSVRTLDDLFCLQDIHTASGSEKNKQPAFFIRNQQTKDLIATIHSANSQSAVKIVNGGPQRGTWACQELVIAYANWISPSFYLHVINTFLSSQDQDQSPTLSTEYTSWRDEKATSIALGFIPAIKDELDVQYKSILSQGHDTAFRLVKMPLASTFSILTKHAIDSIGMFCDQIKLTNEKVQKVARG